MFRITGQQEVYDWFKKNKGKWVTILDIELEIEMERVPLSRAINKMVCFGELKKKRSDEFSYGFMYKLEE